MRRARFVLVVLFVVPATASCASYAYTANRLTPISDWSGVETRDHSSSSELTFLIFGDSGRGNDAQRRVGQCMLQTCQSPEGNGCDFALVLGDNICGGILSAGGGVESATDDSFSKRFETPYAGFTGGGGSARLDFWVVAGNHDWRKSESVQAQIDRSKVSQLWRMPSHHYQVPKLPDWITLYGLETTVMQSLSSERDQEKATQLRADQDQQLAAAGAAMSGGSGWKLLFGHHPVYTSGMHGREGGADGELPALKEALGPLIEERGVQVYFAAHDHHQEHISAAEGFQQIVQGAAGTLRDVPDTTGSSGVRRSKSAYGFGLVRATPQELEIEFYEADEGRCACFYNTTIELSSGAAVSGDCR